MPPRNFAPSAQQAVTNPGFASIMIVDDPLPALEQSLLGGTLSGTQDFAFWSGRMIPSLSIFAVWQWRITCRRALSVVVAGAVFLVGARVEAVIQGIDISAHQGDITAAEWQQIKAAGIQFVFARVSLGACCDFDANYVNNLNRAIAAGIPIGPYSVGYPHTNMSDPNDAANEANYLISLTKSYYQGSGIMLRPVLDIELPSPGTLSKSFTSQWVVKWANTIKAGLGVDPIIYTYTSYAAAELDSSVTSYPLWIANYNYTPPNTPPASTYVPWSSWKFWQYSSTGSVPGISGNVDLDVFDGTFLQMLQQFSPNFSNGDYNNSGVVDAADYAVWRDTMGQSVNPGTSSDGNSNGIIDAGDYDIWKANFGKLVPNIAGSGIGTALVPEPTTLGLLFSAVAAAFRPTPRRHASP
jgi:GH25 family lysozyme M1 (1,4-beta-N-acetylmuramidase)